MTKKEMYLPLAQELRELTDLSWELNSDLEQAKKEGNEKEIERFKTWRTKTLTRIKQTKKVAEMLGLSPQRLENMAFDLAVEAARQA